MVFCPFIIVLTCRIEFSCFSWILVGIYCIRIFLPITFFVLFPSKILPLPIQLFNLLIIQRWGGPRATQEILALCSFFTLHWLLVDTWVDTSLIFFALSHITHFQAFSHQFTIAIYQLCFARFLYRQTSSICHAAVLPTFSWLIASRCIFPTFFWMANQSLIYFNTDKVRAHSSPSFLLQYTVPPLLTWIAYETHRYSVLQSYLAPEWDRLQNGGGGGVLF